jgi:ABC-type bacteriocin/lantibiotic exporter with double-glycine peptidase domain
MVLFSLGFDVSEKEIRARCNYQDWGMWLGSIADGFADLPLNIEYHADWSIDDIKDSLRQAVFPIAGIDLRFLDGEPSYHAVVVTKVASDFVTIHDPRPKHTARKISLSVFESAWVSADNEVLIITPKDPLS